MGIYQNLETLESNLYNAKKSLANTLVGKGVDSNAENETLTQLIGKIDDIQTGGDSSGGYVQPKGLYIRVSNEENIVAQGWEGFVLTDTSRMFAACTSATSITFGESFDTSNVTNMSYMFNGCGKLKSLDFVIVPLLTKLWRAVRPTVLLHHDPARYHIIPNRLRTPVF